MICDMNVGRSAEVRPTIVNQHASGTFSTCHPSRDLRSLQAARTIRRCGPSPNPTGHQRANAQHLESYHEINRILRSRLRLDGWGCTLTFLLFYAHRQNPDKRSCSHFGTDDPMQSRGWSRRLCGRCCGYWSRRSQPQRSAVSREA